MLIWRNVCRLRLVTSGSLPQVYSRAEGPAPNPNLSLQPIYSPYKPSMYLGSDEKPCKIPGFFTKVPPRVPRYDRNHPVGSQKLLKLSSLCKACQLVAVSSFGPPKDHDINHEDPTNLMISGIPLTVGLGAGMFVWSSGSLLLGDLRTATSLKRREAACTVLRCSKQLQVSMPKQRLLEPGHGRDPCCVWQGSSC